MSSIRKIERNRGLKESREQIQVLQDKWPAAFPKQASLVRPLAKGVAKTIAEAFGWSVPYTRAVLMVWKRRAPPKRFSTRSKRPASSSSTRTTADRERGPIVQNGQCWKQQKHSEAGTWGYWQACAEKAGNPAVQRPVRHRV